MAQVNKWYNEKWYNEPATLIREQRDRALDLLDQSPMPANGNMLRADLLKWKYERDILLAECREEERCEACARDMTGYIPHTCKPKEPTARERVDLDMYRFGGVTVETIRILADEIDKRK